MLGLALESERPSKEIVAEIADLYELTPEERQELIPSGRTTLLANRVHWAITYLVQAGLLRRPRRAVVVATDRGRHVYGQQPERIDNDVLAEFPEFNEFKNRSSRLLNLCCVWNGILG